MNSLSIIPRKRPRKHASMAFLPFACCLLFCGTFTTVSCFTISRSTSSSRQTKRHPSSSSQIFASAVQEGTSILFPGTLRQQETDAQTHIHDDALIARELLDRFQEFSAAPAPREEGRRDSYVCKRLAKEIWRDWDHALDTLFRAYPFFDTQSTSVPVMKKEEIHLNGKAISATIEVLGRTNRLKEALLLLDQTADIYTMLRSSASSNEINFVALNRLEADMRSCYRAAISAAGDSGNWRAGLMLLHHHMPERAGLYPNAEAYHSQIAACRKCGAVDGALSLITEMESGSILSSLSIVDSSPRPVPRPDRLAYITAITSCGLNRRCDEAANLLDRMRKHDIAPDISAYNQVLSAYSRSEPKHKSLGGGGRHKDALRLLKVIEEDDNVVANSQTYNLAIKCCGENGAWNEASRIMQKNGAPSSANRNRGDRRVSTIEETMPSDECTNTAYDYSDYYRDLNKLPKHGQGKDVYWEIGRFRRSSLPNGEIIVGLQPHRNPMKNGVSLVFMDATDTSKKLGFMLLRHNTEAHKEEGEAPILFSALIGMLVGEKHRGKGLSNVFVATWMQLCVDLGIFPRAEMMKKPLISAALGKFGFMPLKGGVAVEMSPVSAVKHHDKWEANIALFSPTYQSLEGLYRERDLRVQKMMVSRNPPNPRGKLIHVGTGFHHPVYNPSSADLICENSLEKLTRRIDETLRKSDGSLSLNDDVDLLRKAAFGFIRHT